MVQEKAKNASISHLIAIFIIVIATLLVYVNTLGNDFVFDDKHLIEENDLIRNIANVPAIFNSEFQLKETQTGFYRPLLLTSFLVDYHIWQLSPMGYHLTNLLLHIATTILLYFFVLLLLKDRMIAFCSAILFGLHPVHASNIAWVAGRGDVLCGLFFLLSLFFLVKADSNREKLNCYYFIISLLCFFLALTAKEMAASLPFIIILYIFCFRKEEDKKKHISSLIKLALPYFVVLVGYLFIRFSVIGSVAKRGLELDLLPWRMITMTDITVKYIGLLIYPAKINIYYLIPFIKTIADPRVVFAVFLIAVILWLGIKTYRNSSSMFFAVFWFFITLLPIANIIPGATQLMTEYWLYIPSMGFCILAAIAVKRLPWRKPVLICFTGFLIASALSLISINRTWKNEQVFYERMTTYAPKYYLGHYNLANTYLRQGEKELAVQEYLRAIDLNPDYVSSYTNLGGAYNELHQFDKALEMFQTALTFDPADKELQANIRIVKKNRDKVAGKITTTTKTDKEDELKAIVSRNPDDPNALNNLGAFYAQQGNFNEALKYFERAAAFEPDNNGIYINLGNVYAIKGMHSKAKKAFNHVLDKNKREYIAYLSLANIYKKEGNNELAIEMLNKYLLYSPENMDKNRIKEEIENLKK